MYSYYDFIDSKHNFTLDPFDKDAVQPASVDLRLDSKFCVFTNHLYDSIDPAVEQPGLTQIVDVAEGIPFILHPGEFVLGSTQESVSLSNVVAARLEGKSSLGRLGLVVHSTAGFIDPGFSGYITLELSNVNNLPIKLWPGMKIGQICVFRLNQISPVSYGDATLGSRYQNQRGPTPSRSFMNFTTKRVTDGES